MDVDMDVAEVVESHILRNDVAGLIAAVLARVRAGVEKRGRGLDQHMT